MRYFYSLIPKMGPVQSFGTSKETKLIIRGLPYLLAPYLKAMAILKMLEMYLKENSIRCHVPKNRTYNQGTLPSDRIIVHLKHLDLGSGISLSVSRIELSVKDSKVYGGPERKNDWDAVVPVMITHLADPQAFGRIRMWIRSEETYRRASTESKTAIGRLHNSPYSDHETDLNDVGEILENLKPNPPLQK